MTSSVPFAKFPVAADSKTDRSRRAAWGTHTFLMPGAQGLELSITVEPLPKEDIEGPFKRLAATLNKCAATLVHLTILGKVSASAAAAEAMQRVFGGVDWPVTWVEGSACDGGPLAGLQAVALAGGEVQPIRVDGCVIGSVFEDGAFCHCVLGGVGPASPSAPRADQTRQTLDHLREALVRGGFRLGDLVRTWFFLDDLLLWYDEFNRARTGVYSGVKFRTGSLPASTGIGARNPAGSALVAAAWAMQPLNRTARIEEVASPLQCPASAYGSSFSRAMEMSSPAGRRLFVSGTASIAPGGKTLWPEEPAKQVAQTMEVVQAILETREFSLSHLTRATAYFKRQAYGRFFREWCATNGWAFLPVVSANCDVCRDDLLFELELDAWRPNQR